MKDGKYYMGTTKDVAARLNFHNAALQRSTKHRIPFVLVLHESFPDKASVLNREKQIKSYKSGEAFKRLIEGLSPA
ncbi:MAG: GIY-YIG nuclease family protein [Bacteroidota bacterium]|nr:GIY-YIG nuclease family protein [Bacteroidota bacterium]